MQQNKRQVFFSFEYDADAYAKDKTDTQLDKAIEVMNGLLDK